MSYTSCLSGCIVLASKNRINEIDLFRNSKLIFLQNKKMVGTPMISLEEIILDNLSKYGYVLEEVNLKCVKEYPIIIHVPIDLIKFHNFYMKANMIDDLYHYLLLDKVKNQYIIYDSFIPKIRFSVEKYEINDINIFLDSRVKCYVLKKSKIRYCNKFKIFNFENINNFSYIFDSFINQIESYKDINDFYHANVSLLSDGYISSRLNLINIAKVDFYHEYDEILTELENDLMNCFTEVRLITNKICISKNNKYKNHLNEKVKLLQIADYNLCNFIEENIRERRRQDDIKK